MPVHYKEYFLELLQQHRHHSGAIRDMSAEVDMFTRYATKDFQREITNWSRNKVYILGAGGVASWLLPQLAKVLHAHGIKNNREYEVIIVDGDTVEPKNVLRQNFIESDIGANKAKVLASRYSVYENVKMSYVDKYIYDPFFVQDYDISLETGDKFTTYLDVMDTSQTLFIFNMMDNELSKHMLDYRIAREIYRLEGVRYFCTGCDLKHGLVFTTIPGMQSFYSEYFSDMTFEETDDQIETYSCAEAAVVEQTFDTNVVAATHLSTLVSNCLADKNIITTRLIEFVCTSRPSLSIKESYELELHRLKHAFFEELPKMRNYFSRYGRGGTTKKAKEYETMYEMFDKYLYVDQYI